MDIRLPDITTICFEDEEIILTDNTVFIGGNIEYTLGDVLDVKIKSVDKGVKFIYLRWNTPISKDLLVLGDTWERGYGNFEWRNVDPERNMPWYMAISNGSDSCLDYEGRVTSCFGVGVLPGAMASWSCDEEGITLCLDVRCGAAPVYLGERVLDCATVYFKDYYDTSAYIAVESFCKVMSPKPLLADHVVYGSNNWYYAYGNSSHNAIIEDSRFVVDMCRGLENTPYMVIDDGWQPNNCDAPWDRGNKRFPDMKRLADEMKEIGVRPGIWVRYLINGIKDGKHLMENIPESWYLEGRPETLDPSHPEVLEYVKQVTKTLVGWGYRLIKHDYSTFDIFGIWGGQVKDHLARGNWSFYDKTKTSAEIIKNFYQVIRDNSNNAVIIGCNVIGHLCAGIHHLNRTGDDTSGYDWSRTRKMGVNTLAFRIAQNNAFFGADADCVGITGEIDWKHNKEWLKILSRSGSCLFVSCKLGVLSEDELNDLREGFKYGSYQNDKLIPIDWMETKIPQRYLLNGEEVTFDFSE